MVEEKHDDNHIPESEWAPGYSDEDLMIRADFDDFCNVPSQKYYVDLVNTGKGYGVRSGQLEHHPVLDPEAGVPLHKAIVEFEAAIREVLYLRGFHDEMNEHYTGEDL